jgi:hypothetical protein
VGRSLSIIVLIILPFTCHIYIYVSMKLVSLFVGRPQSTFNLGCVMTGTRNRKKYGEDCICLVKLPPYSNFRLQRKHCCVQTNYQHCTTAHSQQDLFLYCTLRPHSGQHYSNHTESIHTASFRHVTPATYATHSTYSKKYPADRKH